VYQYYFVGKRSAPESTAEGAATEYIFDVTSDRKTTFAVSVFLANEGLKEWATGHGRVLSEAEQYGAVKMRLFQGFDEIEDMISAGRRLFIDNQSLSRLLGTLGVE